MSEKQVSTDFGRRLSPRLSAALAVMFVAGFAAMSDAAATEVYTWTDKDGVKHFTDSPPGHDKAKTIQVEEVYRPGTTDAYPAPAATPPVAPDVANAPSAAQQRREEINKKRQESRVDQAEMDRLCQRHRERLAKVEPSRRVFYTDPSTGEQVRLDDEKRVAMVQEDKDFIAKNCN